MLSEVLSSIEGIRVFPLISLIVFVLAFSAVVIWVIRLDKQTISEAERLPLDAGTPTQEDRRHG